MIWLYQREKRELLGTRLFYSPAIEEKISAPTRTHQPYPFQETEAAQKPAIEFRQRPAAQD
jgi:hypothetical protein